jgi:hypothetical protein
MSREAGVGVGAAVGTAVAARVGRGGAVGGAAGAAATEVGALVGGGGAAAPGPWLGALPLSAGGRQVRVRTNPTTSKATTRSTNNERRMMERIFARMGPGRLDR